MNLTKSIIKLSCAISVLLQASAAYSYDQEFINQKLEQIEIEAIFNKTRTIYADIPDSKYLMFPSSQEPIYQNTLTLFLVDSMARVQCYDDRHTPKRAKGLGCAKIGYPYMTMLEEDKVTQTDHSYIFIHELGHTLNLYHSLNGERRDNIMFAVANTIEFDGTIKNHDFLERHVDAVVNNDHAAVNEIMGQRYVEINAYKVRPASEKPVERNGIASSGIFSNMGASCADITNCKVATQFEEDKFRATIVSYSQSENKVHDNSFEWELSERATVKYDISGNHSEWLYAEYIHTSTTGVVNSINLLTLPGDQFSGILELEEGTHEIVAESKIKGKKFASITIELDIIKQK